MMSFLFYFSNVGLFLIDGTELKYSQVMILTISCRMRFDDFPLDSQVMLKCWLII